MSERLDTRLHAVRPDLADIALLGRVEALRFVAGEPMRIVAPSAPLRHAPSLRASLLTEALLGETVSVFETRPDGWSWVQLASDRYVGWTPSEAVGDPAREPTHKVCVPRTLVFGESDIKAPPIAAFSLGARVTAIGEAEDRNARYRLLAPKGAVVEQHLAALDAFAADWVAVAEQFLGVPYLWGGKTSFGIDCSGLVQVALQAGGHAAPRDTDMQRVLGRALRHDETLPPLQRGDLVFWKGHLGVMRDPETLLHANAHHMAVASEPLRHAVERIAARAGPIQAIKRLD